jgi:Mce-associated membrane protein
MAVETDDGDSTEEVSGPDDVTDVIEADEADVTDEGAPVDEEGESTDRQARRWASVRRPSFRWRRPTLRRPSRVGWALLAGSVAVVTLAGLTGWLGYRQHDKHQAEVQRNLFVQTARQSAVNLTTLNYTEVEADVQRIVDSATGAFRDDFQQRSRPFIDVVKAAQSQSEGTVTEAGLESIRRDWARVLVAVEVKSKTAAGEQAPREWRMRIDVQAVGDGAKVSAVVFVP